MRLAIGDDMDPMIAKLVVSRRKSIETIKAEIAKFEESYKKAGAASPTGQALQGVLTVKRQRLLKLEAELAGFLAAGGDDQVELPGTKSTELPAPGAVLGRGSGRR